MSADTSVQEHIPRQTEPPTQEELTRNQIYYARHREEKRAKVRERYHNRPDVVEKRAERELAPVVAHRFPHTPSHTAGLLSRDVTPDAAAKAYVAVADFMGWLEISYLIEMDRLRRWRVGGVRSASPYDLENQ